MTRRAYRKVVVIPVELRGPFRALQARGHLPRYCIPCVVPDRFTWGAACDRDRLHLVRTNRARRAPTQEVQK